jgi:deoxycytidine triphosphate deaminase
MPKHEEYLWKDPLSQFHGCVLLSDQIQFLATEVAMVDPFLPKRLRPAAYDLCVGNAYYQDDKRKELAENESFAIPANGLVYVRTLERLNIPYYLIARYSLRVQQVYRGLLIDNGLHIDPGYTGYIWIPVHNFTTEPRILVPGQEFLSVEFNRTTPLPQKVKSIMTQDDLVALAVKGQLLGSNHCAIKVFYKDLEQYSKRHEEFTPPVFWTKFLGETHQSAMLGTEQRLGRVKSEVNQRIDEFTKGVEHKINRLSNLGLLAVAGLIVGLLAIILPIWYGRIGSIADTRAAEIKALREQVQEQKVRIEMLTAQQATPNPPPPALKRQPRDR